MLSVGVNLISVSDQQTENLPTLTVKLSGREKLWGKTKEMFLQTEQLARNYDWVLKADDDTFIFMENLKAMLSHFNSSSALIAGALWRCRGNGDCQGDIQHSHWLSIIGPFPAWKPTILMP